VRTRVRSRSSGTSRSNGPSRIGKLYRDDEPPCGISRCVVTHLHCEPPIVLSRRRLSPNRTRLVRSRFAERRPSLVERSPYRECNVRLRWALATLAASAEAAGVSNSIGRCGTCPSVADSGQISRLRTVPPNTPPQGPETWPVIAGRSVEPTGRLREPVSGGNPPRRLHGKVQGGRGNCS
jgi:hypothetical protein